MKAICVGSLSLSLSLSLSVSFSHPPASVSLSLFPTERFKVRLQDQNKVHTAYVVMLEYMWTTGAGQ